VVRRRSAKSNGEARFPLWGNLDHAGLRLITCGGFDSVSAKYEANVVVFADLVNG
jgi:hypothetical protein